MAKGELPGSMDLLLDTMCNTFGGVMFIAISMALTISLCQSKLDPKEMEEQAKEQLQELQKENIQLQNKQKNLDKRMDELRKQPVVKPDVSEELAEQVAQLEMLKRHRERQKQRLKKQLEKVTEENRKLSSDNDRNAKKLAADKQKYVEGKDKLEKRYAELQEENGRLRSTLAQIPPRSIHFARNKRTSSIPYHIIIKNDRVYRLGYKAFESSREVSVRREGNLLLLTPVQGVSIRSLMMERGEDVLPGFNRKRHFVWIIVAPDSFEAFVSFRRFMRKLNFDVHWYTADKMVLYLVENANYSAAN